MIHTASRRPVRASAVLTLLILALTACTPTSTVVRTTEVARPGEVASELQRTAMTAFHRMEIAFLQTGGYTTNALIDLELPQGVRWTLEEFSDTAYRLRFTDDARPETAWLVSPDGVRAADR